MDRKERVLRTFHNEPSDKLLVAFWHHYLEDELVDGLHNPRYIDENLAGARKFKEEFDPDFVKVMTDGLFFMPFNYEDMHSASDLANLKAGDEMELYLDKSVEFAKQIREIYGHDVLMFYNVFSPAFQLSQRMGQVHPEMTDGGAVSPIVPLIKEDPEAVKKALDVIADYTFDLIDRILGTGIAEGMYFSVSCFNKGIDSDLYREFVMPGEKAIIERANRYAKDNILHICGWRGNLNDLSLFVDYDCSVINWAVHSEGVSVAEGKKMFKNKCVIGGFGNNNTDLLCVGTKDEIQDYVEEIVKEAGTTGVIIGADCTTHLDTPDEHLHWVYDKAAEISDRLLKK
jgi:uroporphyrinogen decarboxylase